MPQSNLGPETGMEKVIKYALPVGIGALVIFFWGSIAGFVAEMLKDTTTTIIFGIIDVVLLWAVWWAISNYRFLTKWITGGIVQYNPLFFVYKAIDELIVKKDNISKNIVTIGQQKKNVELQIKELNRSIRENGTLGAAALNEKNMEKAGMYGSMVETDKGDLVELEELRQLAEGSLLKMQKVYDYCNYTVQGLQHDAKRKEQQWEVVKPLVKGLRNADELISSDSEIVRKYGEGMKALESKINQSLAYVDEFDRKSKGVLEGMDDKTNAKTITGLKALEDFMDDKKLLLPTSFPEMEKEQFNSNIGNIAQGKDYLKLLK